jgi:hypothetical protein
LDKEIMPIVLLLNITWVNYLLNIGAGVVLRTQGVRDGFLCSYLFVDKTCRYSRYFTFSVKQVFPNWLCLPQPNADKKYYEYILIENQLGGGL